MRIEYFQLIDRIVDLNLTKRTVTSEAVVPTEHSIFEGHFPGFPLMPGVLLIEAIAQTAGWMIVALNRFERAAILCAVRDAKMRSFVTPGARLKIEGEVKHEGSGYAVVLGKISSESGLVCEATVMLRVTDFPNAQMYDKMREYAARIGLKVEAPADG